MATVSHATQHPSGVDSADGKVSKNAWNEDHLVVGDLVGSGALVFLEQHAASSSASLDFTNFASSAYDEYVIEISQLVPATNLANILLRCSTDGGASYDGGSNYSWAAWRASDAGSAAAGSASTTSIGLDGSGTQSNSSTTGGLNGTVRVFNPLGGAMYTRFTGQIGINDGTGNPDVFVGIAASYKITTAVNALRVLASSGNLTSGTVRIYGVAKSVSVGSSVAAGNVLLEQHAASGSATLDFASFVSAAYDEYIFEFINVMPDTNDVGLRMRMGTGVGPTFDTSSVYGWATYVFRAGANGGATGAEGGAAFIQLTYGSSGTVGISTSANWGGASGHVRLFAPQSSLFKTVEGLFRYLDAEPFRLVNTLTGSYESTTAVTAVRFYMSSGNIASGTIRVYGVPKSVSVGSAAGGLVVLANPGAKGTFPANLTSSSYVDVDATYLKATVSGTGPFLVYANFLCAAVAGGERLRVTIAVDGTNIFGAGGLIITPAGGSYVPIEIAGVSTGILSAGSHTIAIQGKSNSATVNFDGDTAFSVLGSVGTAGVLSVGGDPWLVDVDVQTGSHGNTNWSTLNTSGGIGGSDVESSGAQNDEIYWDLGLPAGTWDLTLVHYAGTNRGIYTVSVDGASVGTIDGYGGSPLVNQVGTITGFTLGAGKHRLKLKMATKNGSSSSYFGTIQHVQLRRTTDGGASVVNSIPRPGIETIVLDPTYGDDFNGPGLDAKWVRNNITSAEETFADGYLDIAFSTATAGRGYYQTPGSMPTNMELILGPIESQELVAGTFMFGPYFVDNSGAGVGWSPYYDGNGYLWNLAGFVYSSTSSSLAGVGGTLFRIGQPYFLRLRKAGTSYYGSITYGTRKWSPETAPQTFSGATRIGFGRMNQNTAGHLVSVGRFTTI